MASIDEIRCPAGAARSKMLSRFLPPQSSVAGRSYRADSFDYDRNPLVLPASFDYDRNMAQEIERSFYLGKLLRFVQSPTCTVVVGLRRVGKCVLLRQLAGKLADRGRVVYIDKEDLQFDTIREARDLVRLVGGQRGDRRPTYVIVDEVQQIHD